MEIPKEYFTLGEVLARWKIPEADLRYLAETDQLRLSIVVFNRHLELGCHEEIDKGRSARVPWHHGRFNGLLDLHAEDVHALFRYGGWRVSEFRHAHADYGWLLEDDDFIELRAEDLQVRRAERDRLEHELGLNPIHRERPERVVGFQATPDYRAVVVGHRAFKLGPIQAKIIALLHRAARDGVPWQSGKDILSKAGSRCLRMQDVFKSQPGWRELIESDGRGAYRLILE
jgi:hypothetical protein